jgi:hypothetical protein
MSSSDLRRAIDRQKSSCSDRGARYPAELRHQVAEYFRAQRSEGRPLREIASELGLPINTLNRWSERTDASGRVRRVEVVESPPSGSPVLICASGYRVEGLDLSSLALLLERLA